MLWPIWVDACGEAGLEVAPQKCVAWIPSLSLDHARFISIKDTFSPVELSANSLPVLGTVNDGINATLLSAGSADNPFLDKRLQDALSLASNIKKLSSSYASKFTSQVCWLLMVHCLSHKLTYDFRICTPASCALHAEKLFVSLQDCAIHVLPSFARAAMNDTSKAQLFLPGKLGGLFLPYPPDVANVAPACALLQSGLFAEQWMVQHAGCSLDILPSLRDAATSCLGFLTDKNIFLTANGQPSLSLSRHTLEVEFPRKLEVSNTLGPILNALAAKRSETVLTSLRLEDKARFLSCAGEGNGDIFRSFPYDESLQLDNYAFEAAMCWRLGLPVISAVSQCQHKFVDKADHCAQMCEHILNITGHHVAICSIGGWVAMRHNAIRNLLAEICKAAGLFTLIEQVVQKLSSKHLAKLDVCAWSAYPALEYYFDVVVSHPCAPSYVSKAALCPGSTASQAAAKKIAKYGNEVTPWSLETYGALDDTLLSTLKDLANLASARDRSFGYMPRPYLKIWKSQISAALARAFALSLRMATTPTQSNHELQVLSLEERLARSIDSGVIPVNPISPGPLPQFDAPVYPAPSILPPSG